MMYALGVPGYILGVPGYIHEIYSEGTRVHTRSILWDGPGTYTRHTLGVSRHLLPTRYGILVRLTLDWAFDR